jgi:imidazolonepropionase-like amidohydrolase
MPGVRFIPLLASLSLVLAALGAPAQDSRPPLTSIVLAHVTVIGTSGAPPRANMTVVVSSGRIERIERAAASRSSPRRGQILIDATGKFLIPGLWDMHTHVAGINAKPEWAAGVLLPLLIANGITGIRDMGGDLDALLSWRTQIEKGEIIGPRIVAAGPMLLPARPAAQDPPDPAILRVGSPAEARSAVHSLQKRGSDFIKVIDLPRDAYFAVAEESKRAGIAFAGHVPSEVTASEASNAGQRSIEHIIYSSLAFDCSSQSEALRKKAADADARGDSRAAEEVRDEANRTFSAEKAAALWATFIRNGTWLTPTLYSIRANAHHLEDSAADPLLAYLPPALRQEWAPRPPSDAQRGAAAWWQRQFENDRKLTGEMHRAGVRLLAGSDSLDRYVFVGISLHRELEMLVDAGLTPLEALQAATRNPADFLGRTDSGDVAPGKRADLVLLEANPLESIANTQKIAAVIVAGKYLSRSDLDAMLAGAHSAAAAVGSTKASP